MDGLGVGCARLLFISRWRANDKLHKQHVTSLIGTLLSIRVT